MALASPGHRRGVQFEIQLNSNCRRPWVCRNDGDGGALASIQSFFCHAAVSRFSPVGPYFTAFGWEGVVEGSNCFVSYYENSL
jgi:hypothetical protein